MFNLYVVCVPGIYCVSCMHNNVCDFTFYQMLKHGRAGVPMEVMGLMLGEFVDDYTVQVIDVFAMPQSGTVSFYIYHSCEVYCHNC